MKYFFITLYLIITATSCHSIPEIYTHKNETVLSVNFENLQKCANFVLKSVEKRSTTQNLDAKITKFTQEYTLLLQAYTSTNTTALATHCKNCLCYAKELAQEFKLHEAEHHYTGHAHIYNVIQCLKNIKNTLLYNNLLNN